MLKNGSKPTRSYEFIQRLLLFRVVSEVCANEQLHANKPIIMCWHEVAHYHRPHSLTGKAIAFEYIHLNGWAWSHS